MRQGNNFLKTAVQLMESGDTPLPGVPLIEIYDQRRVLIENHHGVIGYGCHEVLVKVQFGVVCVCGEDLRLNKMSRDQLIITGRICAVNLRRGR